MIVLGGAAHTLWRCGHDGSTALRAAWNWVVELKRRSGGLRSAALVAALNWINESMNHWINETMNQWINESINIYKSYIIYKIYKNYKIWIMEFIHNIFSFLKFSDSVESFRFFFSNALWHCWCILYNKLLFWIQDSDSLYLTVYRNMV